MTLRFILITGALLVSATIASAADHIVTISGFAFKPASLTIAAGDSVTFVNKDGAPHTATQNAQAFDTGRLGRNEEGNVTFATVGSFSYFCKFHPGMKGKIEVE